MYKKVPFRLFWNNVLYLLMVEIRSQASTIVTVQKFQFQVFIQYGAIHAETLFLGTHGIN